VDLLASKFPVIHGAPPLSDSNSLRGKRVFFNGKVDYEGPARLPNATKTWIRKQVGGGKPPASKTDPGSDIEDIFDLSPSPAPKHLHSTKQKGAKGSVTNVEEEKDSPPLIRLPKSTFRQKKVEVVVTKRPGKATMGEPSIITIQDTSDSDYILEEINAGDKHGALIDSSSNACPSEEQVPYTRKRKATRQDSSHAVKRAATSVDKSTRELSEGMQQSSTRNARFRFNSPLDTDSSGDNEPKTNSREGHMLGTLGRVNKGRSAMHMDTYLSKMLQASEDVCKLSHIKSMLVSSLEPLQRRNYNTLPIHYHKALRTVVSTHVGRLT